MRKAVILAAGRGTRLGALTDEIPKPMVPVKGKPILEHLLDRLRAAGFEEALIVTGYRAEAIESHFGNYAIPLHFVRQTVINGTATAAMLAREFTGSEPYFFTYGDILAEIEVYRGMRESLDAGTEALIGVKWVDDPYQGAAVYVEPDKKITKIIEKPGWGKSTTKWNSAGLYVFRPGLYAELARVPESPRGEFELTSAIAQLIDAGQRLEIYPIEGAWRDIGRPEDLAAAEEMT
jgi:NDP-sugar pyrophosphorylase family protein